MDRHERSVQKDPVVDPLVLELALHKRQVQVRVAGDIDLATTPELRAFLLGAALPDTTDVIVDLTDVTFLDSSGIGVLILAAREAAEAGASFRLLCPPDNTAVGKVLEILQVSTMIPVITTLSSPRKPS